MLGGITGLVENEKVLWHWRLCNAWRLKDPKSAFKMYEMAFSSHESPSTCTHWSTVIHILSTFSMVTCVFAIHFHILNRPKMLFFFIRNAFLFHIIINEFICNVFFDVPVFTISTTSLTLKPSFYVFHSLQRIPPSRVWSRVEGWVGEGWRAATIWVWEWVEWKRNLNFMKIARINPHREFSQRADS